MTDDLRRLANEIDRQGTHVSDNELLVLISGTRRELEDLYPGIPPTKIIRAFLAVAAVHAMENDMKMGDCLSWLRAAFQRRLDRTLPEKSRIITPDRFNDLKLRRRAGG